jgi:hypothetical protein
VGGENPDVGELAGLGKVCVGLAMRKRGFKHGLQHVCLLQLFKVVLGGGGTLRKISKHGALKYRVCFIHEQ